MTTGNASLKPATADSFDFSIEKYLPHGGILSVGVFDREISNYIVPIQTSQTFNNNLFLNANLSQPLQVFTYGNRGSAFAR